ncbi:MAG: imidazole glycerol phosphate synthase subunit HisH [Candidatus Rokuibacteriota bacterium]
MIAIVDYGRGNLGSVRKALARVGGEVLVTDARRVVERADALVVPGDGAFKDAMQSLERLGLLESIRAHIDAGRPYLGICLGYQLLFTESEEFGHAKGLDILPGAVRRFPAGLKVPHMGWNRLSFGARGADGLPILSGIPDGAYFYFVHSYYPEPADAGDCALATCEYGITFPALLARGTLHGTQFHPEKSQRWGLALLENFARSIGTRAAGIER